MIQPLFRKKFWFMYIVVHILFKTNSAEVTFSFEKNSCHYLEESLILIGKYTGTLTVTAVDWYFEHKTRNNNQVSNFIACEPFGIPEPGYPNERMNYSCDTTTNTYRANIYNLNVTENGMWGVSFRLSDGSATTLITKDFTLCMECSVEPVENGKANDTGKLRENEVVGVACDDLTTFQLTCQSNGTWVPGWPLCEATITTSNTTINGTTNVPSTGKQPGPIDDCKLIICFIGGIISIVAAIAIVVFYFVKYTDIKKWKELRYPVMLPAGFTMVVCIILVAVLCPLVSKCEEKKVLGIVLGIVLVILTNPGCSVGICLIHHHFCRHCCNNDDHDRDAGTKMQSKDAGNKHVSAGGQGTGRSCFGKKNAILPICSGQDEGRQCGPRHGHSKGNWPRPQPAGGESCQPHDGHKNMETPFKPRRLPEIPTADNKSRGLSANSDEVLPEKKRLTPLGQEAKDSHEERPRKKKKKMKNEADDESEY